MRNIAARMRPGYRAWQRVARKKVALRWSLQRTREVYPRRHKILVSLSCQKVNERNSKFGVHSAYSSSSQQIQVQEVRHHVRQSRVCQPLAATLRGGAAQVTKFRIS